MEVDSEAEWFQGVDQHGNTNPGYRQMIEWLRGKCFKDYEQAKLAYEAKP